MRRLLIGLLTFALTGVASGVALAEEPIRVLIFSGQSNHDWKTTTPLLVEMLEATGEFAVEVTHHPEQCDAAVFEKHDVLVSDWNTFGKPVVTEWPDVTKDAFLDFVRGGGGFVAVHGGSSSFPDWDDYHRIAGASWGRTTRHGQRHTNTVRMLDEVHPVTAGLPDFETFDEFWEGSRVVEEATPLAAVVPDPQYDGGGKAEPVAFVTEYGRGRGFTVLLGHDIRALQSPGFQDLFVRGTEWAATGEVKRTVEEPLWHWEAELGSRKPYFHPLLTADHVELTAFRPADHPWHRGLWWSWKFINGLNYWEEDPQTEQSQGRTRIVSNRMHRTLDGSTEITTSLAYHPPGESNVMEETRRILVTPPDERGNYFIDWTSEFTALANEVLLDRTPLPNEEGGKSWGGYAGLSARPRAGMPDTVYRNSDGLSGASATHGKTARWIDYAGSQGGVAIFDHPDNLRHPSPWYVNEGMPFFGPSPLFNSSLKLERGETLKVRYRILIHAKPLTPTELENVWQNFANR